MMKSHNFNSYYRGIKVTVKAKDKSEKNGNKFIYRGVKYTKDNKENNVSSSGVYRGIRWEDK
jgi:hypothetical protein